MTKDRNRLVATILQILGAGLVSAGAAMVFLPAGFIVAGVFAVLFGLSLERADAE